MSDMKYGITEQLHPDTADLVNRFATALAAKLLAAQKKYGYTNGWAQGDWERECRAQMFDHTVKGDPLDVAAFCAFMWHHHWHTWGVSALTPQRPYTCPYCDQREGSAHGVRAEGGDHAR